MSDDGERDLVPIVRVDPSWSPTEEQARVLRAVVEGGAELPSGLLHPKRPLQLSGNNPENTSMRLPGMGPDEYVVPLLTGFPTREADRERKRRSTAS